tara:strand:+ start:859 stop:1077 length:219 start_codon:yes stop_codon:yes gene_type:complete
VEQKSNEHNVMAKLSLEDNEKSISCGRLSDVFFLAQEEGMMIRFSILSLAEVRKTMAWRRREESMKSAQRRS